MSSNHAIDGNDDLEKTHMTLGQFCNICRKHGCEDDTIIEIFYCHLSGFEVKEVEWIDTGEKELAICIN